MSTDMEMALVGGLMKIKNPESELASYIFSYLKPASFYTNVYKEIYKTILLMANNKLMFDHLSVAQKLQNNNVVELLDIDRCYQYYADTSVIRTYAKSIKSSAIERYSIMKISELPDIISNEENGTIQERIGLAESVINSLIDGVQNRDENGLKDGAEIANKWIDDIESFLNGTVKPFSLGIAGLDDILAPKGIKSGSLVVVGARPKMGKSFFGTKVASHFVNVRNEACCVFSLEMGDTDVWERMLAEKAKTNSNNFYTIPMDNNAYWDSVGNSNVELANTKIFIDDSAGITVNHIKSEVRRVHKSTKVGCVIVDYLTLMEGNTNSERNDLKYGEITKQLKILAKELGCIILLLTQLNRNLESRTDKRPMPSDSRDTGQIEQDCDVWIGLYRERVYDENAPFNFTEAIIRLNRLGDGGTAYMTLQNGYFEDVGSIEAQKQIDEYRQKGIDNDERNGREFKNKYKRS